MIKQITLYGADGMYSVSDPAIAYVTPLKVKRGGLGFDIVYSSPGSRQCQYDSGGTLTFSVPFVGDVNPAYDVLNPPEPVYVLYKD